MNQKREQRSYLLSTCKSPHWKIVRNRCPDYQPQFGCRLDKSFVTRIVRGWLGQVVLRAVEKSGVALQFADESLRADKDSFHISSAPFKKSGTVFTTFIKKSALRQRLDLSLLSAFCYPSIASSELQIGCSMFWRFILGPIAQSTQEGTFTANHRNKIK